MTFGAGRTPNRERLANMSEPSSDGDTPKISTARPTMPAKATAPPPAAPRGARAAQVAIDNLRAGAARANGPGPLPAAKAAAMQPKAVRIAADALAKQRAVAPQPTPSIQNAQPQGAGLTVNRLLQGSNAMSALRPQVPALVAALAGAKATPAPAAARPAAAAAATMRPSSPRTQKAERAARHATRRSKTDRDKSMQGRRVTSRDHHADPDVGGYSPALSDVSMRSVRADIAGGGGGGGLPSASAKPMPRRPTFMPLIDTSGNAGFDRPSTSKSSMASMASARSTHSVGLRGDPLYHDQRQMQGEDERRRRAALQRRQHATRASVAYQNQHAADSDDEAFLEDDDADMANDDPEDETRSVASGQGLNHERELANDLFITLRPAGGRELEQYTRPAAGLQWEPTGARPTTAVGLDGRMAPNEPMDQTAAFTALGAGAYAGQTLNQIKRHLRRVSPPGFRQFSLGNTSGLAAILLVRRLGEDHGTDDVLDQQIQDAITSMLRTHEPERIQQAGATANAVYHGIRDAYLVHGDNDEQRNTIADIDAATRVGLLHPMLPNFVTGNARAAGSRLVERLVDRAPQPERPAEPSAARTAEAAARSAPANAGNRPS